MSQHTDRSPATSGQYTPVVSQPPGQKRSWPDTARGLVMIAQIAGIVFGFLVILGFAVATPMRRLAVLERKERVQEQIGKSTYALVRAMARERCQNLDQRDWQKLGLPCGELLRGESLPSFDSDSTDGAIP